jgi:hypothetical protein
MHFLSPALLHLAWLALIPLALYLFRKRARRVSVSTLVFFRSLSREHQESASLRKFKNWLSLLLTLLVILLSVLALARPTSDSGQNAPGAIVLLIDRSASMAARDAQGETCLDKAKKLLQQRLKDLPDEVVLSLIAYDAKPHVLLSRSRNRRECLRLLGEIQTIPVEDRPAAALTLSRRLAELESRSQVWHAGDTAFTNTDRLSYTFLDAAMRSPQNIGITDFQIRQAPMARDRFEAFVKVSAAKSNRTNISSTLEISLAGRLLQLRELELQPGLSATFILPLEGVRGQRLELRLQTPGDDLGWDDAVVTFLPQTRPIIVAWVADQADPFTELAMTSMIEAGRIELLKSAPAAWPLKDMPDVYVFEGWLPNHWPTDRPVIALNPPQSSGPVQVAQLPEPGLPHDSVRNVAPDHPLLYRVSTSRLAITQTSILQLNTTLEPLWMAGTEPILAAGEASGQRLVISTFSPARSEQLALMPAFPLLLGNALYWCAEKTNAMSELRPQHPGDLLNEAGLIQWTEWDGNQFVEITHDSSNGLFAIEQIGAWQSSDHQGTSILGSAKETDLPRLNENAPAPLALPFISAAVGFRDWPFVLVWTVLLLLILESWLFHRKAVF